MHLGLGLVTAIPWMKRSSSTFITEMGSHLSRLITYFFFLFLFFLNFSPFSWSAVISKAWESEIYKVHRQNFKNLLYIGSSYVLTLKEIPYGGKVGLWRG